MTEQLEFIWEPDTSGFETRRLGDITVDVSNNLRLVDDALVDEYADDIVRKGDDWHVNFPRMRITADNTLFGGFHRYNALMKVFGADKSVRVEVFPGDESNAFLLATGENVDHGRRRTSAEKRYAVQRWLTNEYGRTCSNRMIADYCQVSVQSVANAEEQLSKNGQLAGTPNETAVDEKRERGLDRDGADWEERERERQWRAGNSGEWRVSAGTGDGCRK